jgi:beta-glucosidase
MARILAPRAATARVRPPGQGKDREIGGMSLRKLLQLFVCAAASLGAGRAAALPVWLDTGRTAEERAAALLAALTPAEKRALLIGAFAVNIPIANIHKPPGAVGSAGYVPGVPRLGIPALQETDSTLGIANPFDVRPGDAAVALPAGLATAASFNSEIAYANGVLLGREAAARGLNVLLGPGLNLTRDPRGGRNFEYLGEDPLLAGTLAGDIARGIQDQHVIAVAKHFAANDQETGRQIVDMEIPEPALRESDLLAFEIALGRGHAGAVMCAYNKLNGPYACGSAPLLQDTLKHDWGFPGFVMSDWGAVHSATDLANGLDQESAAGLDDRAYFGAPLDAAIAAGLVPPTRIDDAARRILHSIIAAGLLEPHAKPVVDVKADIAVARAAEAEGIVLLRNPSAVLPLPPNLSCLVVAGGESDAGVPAGGGSSEVSPVGGIARKTELGGEGLAALFRHQVYDPPAPLAAVRAHLPHAKIIWVDGRYPAQAALLSAHCPAAIVFVQQWAGEDSDIPDLTLPGGQDALVAAVTHANPHTVVVLETGGPVLMPWLNHAGAVLEAWYGGSGGGDAIAGVLFGEINPSGRLPMTFPASALDLPNPNLPGQYLPAGQHFAATFPEGSNVGYRWYAATRKRPQFPFGFGLSYTDFAYSNLRVSGGQTLSLNFDVRNIGKRPGADVTQAYLTARGGHALTRLLGWHKQSLQPGETAHVTLTADPRLLADYQLAPHQFHIPGGAMTVGVGADAGDLKLSGSAVVDDRMLAP